MDENELIAHARQLADGQGLPRGPALIGIGDDACVWSPGGDTCLSVDSIVCGRHFTAETAAATPQLVGRKAAAAAISDLAAMAAKPVGAAVALHCPSDIDGAAVMDGLTAELTRHGCPLLGGDTTGASELVIGVTVWGEAWPDGRLLRRDQGQTGDILVATGWLGGSLQHGRHLTPEPRLAEARWFAERDFVHAAMDISDGLASDMPKLAHASGCGCVLMAENCKVHSDVPPASDIFKAACTDGEDYELLVAIDATAWPTLQLAWPFVELPLAMVGMLTGDGQMVMEVPNTRRCVPLTWSGYQHH